MLVHFTAHRLANLSPFNSHNLCPFSEFRSLVLCTNSCWLVWIPTPAVQRSGLSRRLVVTRCQCFLGMGSVGDLLSSLRFLISDKTQKRGFVVLAGLWMWWGFAVST
jgi:hypothetical protein